MALVTKGRLIYGVEEEGVDGLERSFVHQQSFSPEDNISRPPLLGVSRQNRSVLLAQVPHLAFKWPIDRYLCQCQQRCLAIRKLRGRTVVV